MRSAARALTLLVLATAALAGACARGSSEPAPRLLEALARRDVVDGAALRSMTITVRFSRSPDFRASRLPLASYFEIRIPAPGGTDERVLIQDAQVMAGNSRLVTLRVQRLVPDGSVLRFALRALDAAAGDEEVEVEVLSDVDEFAAVMATTPLTFSDLALVSEAREAPVSERDRDPAAMRQVLRAHLEARGSTADLQARALAAYDALDPAVVPSPKLRAALAALVGTFAGAAVEDLVGGLNCTGAPAALIDFQPPPDLPRLLGRSTLDTGGRRVISIRPDLEGERLEALMPLLAHEAIHCDEADGRFEEIAATAFDTLLYLQLLQAFPEMALAGTTLVRELNIDALALINSGRLLPESAGVLPSDGFAQALPGTGSPHQSFAEVVAAAYPSIYVNESPAETLALTYAALLAESLGMAAADPFDPVYLDELIGRAVSPPFLLAAIEILRLEPG